MNVDDIRHFRRRVLAPKPSGHEDASAKQTDAFESDQRVEEALERSAAAERHEMSDNAWPMNKAAPKR
jgi:hypothetical protein